MWVTKLLISPVKKGFLAQKRPKIGIFVHCWLIWCPVGGMVGDCGARAVSRKTPIYFNLILYLFSLTDFQRPFLDASQDQPLTKHKSLLRPPFSLS